MSIALAVIYKLIILLLEFIELRGFVLQMKRVFGNSHLKIHGVLLDFRLIRRVSLLNFS